MKQKLLRLSALLVLLVALSVVPGLSSGISSVPSGAGFPSGQETTTTVKVTITAIDMATNTITLKDENGKIYVFVVDPLKIDLRKYRVGQSFTATIATTVTTNQVTRARISKSQLIRLQ